MGRAKFFQATASLWQLVDQSDEELERTDLVAMNLIVAKGIPSLKDIDIEHYCRIVDEWTEQFRKELPDRERRFHASPQNWKNDIRFFRVGMLQGFLGSVIGIRYIEEQKNANAVYYTNPNDLFLNGIIDRKEGTCGNMAALHVAMSRRMGWPVSIACAQSHYLSRFDDGEVIHNIEATNTRPGTFDSEPDSEYIKRFNLTKKAIECGSDLRRLTAREMLGTFLVSRARHFQDIGDWENSDFNYSLSRALFPKYRKGFIAAMVRTMRRGEQLFDPDETGHPKSLFPLIFGPKHHSATYAADYAFWSQPVHSFTEQLSKVTSH